MERTPPFKAGFPRRGTNGGFSGFSGDSSWDEPFQLHSGPSPRQAAGESAACWVPPGETRRVRGWELPGGMLYVGGRLRGLSPWEVADPALINPRLTVHPGRPSWQDEVMDYRGYAAISPASRAAYLEWLAGGRRDPGVGIRYVYLFFYGLERRLLLDAMFLAEAREEVEILIAEIERLRDLYGCYLRFREHAGDLLEIAQAYRKDLEMPERPYGPHCGEVPFRVKLALGRFAQDRRPIPADWAFIWLESDPRTRLRTPAHRCHREFAELFKLRYRQKFRGGLVVRPTRERLTISYRAASPTFPGKFYGEIPNTPDVTWLPEPFEALRELAEEVCRELDVYSRWIARTDDWEGPAAMAVLPGELARSRGDFASQALRTWTERTLCGGETAIVPVRDLVDRWPCATPGKLTRREAEMLASFLGHEGYGLEPDVRFGSPALSATGHAVLFHLPGDGAIRPESSREYLVAVLLVRLATAVARAGDELRSEPERLLAGVLATFRLPDPAERARLGAHLRWLLREKPGLAGVRRRIGALDDAEHRRIARGLLHVTAGDGRVTAGEIRVLAQVCPWLGLPAAGVYSAIHALASAGPQAAEPVTIRSGGDLDPQRVEAMRAATREVAELLDGIFRDGDGDGDGDEDGDGDGETPAGLMGLDPAHSELLRRLSRQSAWDRTAVGELAASLDLMPEGALEVINEAAVATVGGPILEGDDIVEIDPELLSEILT
ncbi:MAG: hypothetical protein GY856_06245 [bacterium]|nr:hypothetical protein [bacterium]